MVTAAELVQELVDLVRAVADELGATSLLGALAPPAEGEAQLEVGRRDGLRPVTAMVVERTLR
jgi:hypothetical protein